MGIEIRKEHGRYTIYIEDKFYCTCENMKEVTEELEEYERENQGDYQATG